MKLSRMFAPTLREIPAEAEIDSHRLMLRSGLIRKVASGIYCFLPLGYRVLRKIEQIIREEMDAIGCQELIMPALLPSECYKASGRWEVFGPEMFRLKDRAERDFCLGPTHEEIFTEIVKNGISSYKSLPLMLYQFQTKYRDEIRPRFGVMRAKEFFMKDAYSFDCDEEGLDISYQRMRQAYCNIFSRLSLNYVVVDADPGTMGGSGSQEFMVASNIGESLLLICTNCGFAANHEALPEGATDKCPSCGHAAITSRGIEVGHIFKLGTKYSSALDCKYVDASGAKKSMLMGSYGIGIGRTMASIIEQNSDDAGIIWPMAVAPYQVIVTPVNPSIEPLQLKYALEIYDFLRKNDVEVLIDDRDERVGVKFKDADLLGIPIRITVGKKIGEGIVEFKLRKDVHYREFSIKDALQETIKLIK